MRQQQARTADEPAVRTAGCRRIASSVGLGNTRPMRDTVPETEIETQQPSSHQPNSLVPSLGSFTSCCATSSRTLWQLHVVCFNGFYPRRLVTHQAITLFTTNRSSISQHMLLTSSRPSPPTRSWHFSHCLCMGPTPLSAITNSQHHNFSSRKPRHHKWDECFYALLDAPLTQKLTTCFTPSTPAMEPTAETCCS